MNKIMKKMSLSILSSILVLIVTVTTTYAWTGILSYSSVDIFDIGLEKVETSDYSIQISLDGIRFADTISLKSLKRNVLKNMDLMINVDNLTDKEVERLFQEIRLMPLSVKRQQQSLGYFVSLDEVLSNDFSYGLKTEEISSVKKSYFNFDLYLSFEYIDPSSINDSIKNKNLEIYLSNIQKLMSSNSKKSILSNTYQFENYFSGIVFDEVEVNAASAARTALTKYPTVEKGKPELYQGMEPIKTYIYQGGTDTPSQTGPETYSFGGLMPSTDNIAFSEYNAIHGKKLSSDRLEEFIEGRPDEIAIANSPEEWIVTSDDELTIQKMVKFNIRMWVEGFDADCFYVINSMPIALNLIFATRSDEE